VVAPSGQNPRAVRRPSGGGGLEQSHDRHRTSGGAGRDRPDEEATNLARLLIESGRIDEVQDVDDEFQRLADEAAGRVRATVTTAIELEAADRDRVTRELSKRLDKDVRLSLVVDPRILGGMKLQYGDRIVDASVATRLEQLRRRLAAS